MIQPERFLDELRAAGFGLFSGVPCSYLTPLINTLIDSAESEYIKAANEGEAVAIACGARLGGTRSMVMFQNSGLGNAVSPLTSLTAVFRIPVLLITTWRGQPGGPADEPQHRFMGQITPKLLELMGIPWEKFPERDDQVAPTIARAVTHMDATGTPYGLIMTKGAVAAHELQTRPDPDRRHRPSELPTTPKWSIPLDPDDVLRTIQTNAAETDVLLATTGFTGRALYALEDRRNQLYMVGSMGCVSSLGLGLARVQPQRRIVVIDGDGALLMRMGALAVIGHEKPENLLHIVLDNGVHDSTGSQATVSASLDLPLVAAACGYPHAVGIDDLDSLQHELTSPDQSLKFIHVRTKPREDRKLPRPEITPAQIAERLGQWMGTKECTKTEECAC